MFLLQPYLENEQVEIIPLKESDFEKLYNVASDPKIWEQHPNKTRYKKEVFTNFFEGAIKSGGAFLVVDKTSREIAGSTRFYDFDTFDNSIFIGYTFYATRFWGTGMNKIVKKLMLDYAFQFVDVVKFHVGKENFRSRKAMEKLGGKLVNEMPIAYFGEEPKVNVEFQIKKEDWIIDNRETKY